MNAWTYAYNLTRHMWMVWRDGSPAIAFCVVEKDARTIAELLTRANVA